MTGLVGCLDHQHRVLRRVERTQGRAVVAELVAEDEREMAHVHPALPDPPRFESVRQRSEQYFTSCQFFAQARRQLIARPHCTHGLLGSACLLPRKLGVGAMFSVNSMQRAPSLGHR